MYTQEHWNAILTSMNKRLQMIFPRITYSYAEQVSKTKERRWVQGV